MSRENIHATGLVLGDYGIILRGPSGGGKSLLALELMDEWEARGRDAKLISDDRIEIEHVGGKIVMHAPKAIEGLIELRGRGIVQRPFVASAPLDLVVDMVDTLERMIEEDQLTTKLLGVSVARAPIPRAGVINSRQQEILIREALRALTPPSRRSKKTA
jgi:serine kinase of HPr protein (carbohydrate metabolism regulator)